MLNHRMFFFFGLVYYLMLPILVGELRLFSTYPGMQYWMDTYTLLTQPQKIHYFAAIVMYGISFWLGSFVFKVKKNELPPLARNSSWYNFIGMPLLFLILLVVLQNRSILFSGYEDYNTQLLGTIATLNIIALFILFYALFSGRGYSLTFFIPAVTVLISSVVLLGFGSRMYVLIPIIAIFMYKVDYAQARWGKRHILIGVSAVLALVLFVGAWRIKGALSMDFFAYLFLAEPVFTWWSAGSFIAHNEINVVELPISYMSSFLNFIPSVLFPTKAEYIINLKSLYQYEAPLGATSLFVSIQGNFGILFGGIFLFLLGAYYSLIRHLSQKSAFFQVYYILICAVLPFQFFRDEFAIVNKQLFWNMLLIPWIIKFGVSFLVTIMPTKQKVPHENHL